jgi:hypothetical protein
MTTFLAAGRLRAWLLALAAAAAILFVAHPARADLIDFEAQATGRGGLFTGHLDSPLTIGRATFTGGELLKNESGGVDLTGVYATSGPNFLGGAYTDPLTITFSQPVSGFSIVVTNNSPGNGISDTYTVADNLGGSQSNSLGNNAPATFTLPDTGITSVTISAANHASWDFAIDNVSFTPNAVATPEPASLTMLGIGVVGITGYFLRRRKKADPAAC